MHFVLRLETLHYMVTVLFKYMGLAVKKSLKGALNDVQNSWWTANCDDTPKLL